MAAIHHPLSGLKQVALAATIAVLAAACTSGSSTDSQSASDPAAAAAAALETILSPEATTTTAAPHDATDDAAHPTGELTEPLDPTSIPGVIINQYSLAVGDCFDQIRDLQNGQQVTITTKLGCFTPHKFQVFYRLEFPAGSPAIYPGDKVMREFARNSCYRKFESWVGSKYEVSALDIDVLTPTQENFEDSVARYRGIHCFVFRLDGEPLTASTRRSEL